MKHSSVTIPIAIAALALQLQACTVAGLVIGPIVGHNCALDRRRDAGQPVDESDRASVGTRMLVGGVIGAVIDGLVVYAIISSVGLGGFGLGGDDQAPSDRW